MHKVPIFSLLDHKDIVNIAELIIHRDFQKGEIIVAEGDKSDAIVIIHGGSTKAYKYAPDGREQILYIFSEGDFFGEQHLLSNQTAAFTVEALEPVKTCMFSRAQFENLLLNFPNIGIKIIEELSIRITRLENTLQSMGVRNIDTRIGGLLLEFEAKYGTIAPEGTLIRLPLSREGIANYLGITRETMSRKLGQLESEGVIRSVTNKTILIINHDALVAIAGLVE